MRILFLSQMAPSDHPWRAPSDQFPPMPDERQWISRVFTELGVAVEIVDTTCEPLLEPQGFDGVVVGGSLGSANDRESWRINLENWLRRWTEVPLIGICGGHQLLARALGGEVTVMPAPQFGVFPLTLPEVAGFSGRVVQLHAETVSRCPVEATVWAQDPFGVQALKYGPTRWTFQFHPEIEAQGARDLGTRVGQQAWPEVDAAVTDGRAILKAWIDQLRDGVSGAGL